MPSSLTEEMKNRVYACSYEFGTDIDNVHTVLRVVLRDELLKLLAAPPRAIPR